MKILHICNGFAGSKVHSNLSKCLDSIGIEQIIYCPVREERLVGSNRFDGKAIDYAYSYCIKPWYKYVFHYKAFKLYKDLKRKVDLRNVYFIHAHTLFSDGVLAYKAYKEYGIKYCVAIRNTDINDYIRLLKHTYSTGRKILLNAERIFFISEGLKIQFIKSCFVKPILGKIQDKFVVQPNGIETFWHDHISTEKRTGHDILYVGDFSANKNVARLAQAVIELRKEKGFEDVKLKIVGGESQNTIHVNDGQTQKMIDDNPEVIIGLGKIYDKSKLADVMKSCSVFAMVSIYETFGLVYLEALSQNLPVVFTKGQGIDGMFDETIGIGVNPLSIVDIKNAIKTILEKHDFFSNANVDFQKFDWNEIAEYYKCMYEHYKNIDKNRN